MNNRHPDRHRPLDVLMLCGPFQNMAATVEDHIRAIERCSRNRCFMFPLMGDFLVDLDLSRFDVVIVHYTIVACHDLFLSPRSRERIRQFNGLKAMFIQDEYRFVDATVATMQHLGIDVLFTCVPESEVEKVYSRHKLPRTRKVHVLTGYVPEHLLKQPVAPPAARKIDVGYRGRALPAWLGELGQEKWRIGDRFSRDAAAYGLQCDIAWREEDRLYGAAWIKFLTSCKAMLGVESGASVFDFTGEIQRRVEEHRRRDPEVTFEELRARYFKDLEGRIKLNQISPRSFECAALRTVMILYEGEYSGILKPWRHYIPLKKNHSNMAEVVAALRDEKLCEGIADNAYWEVANNEAYSFRAFVREVDRALEEAFQPVMGKTQGAFGEDEFSEVWSRQEREFVRMRRRQWLLMCVSHAAARIKSMAHRMLFRGVLFWASPELKERIRLHLRRLFYGKFHTPLSDRKAD